MNKVTESGIINGLILEEYLFKEEMEIFDIKEFLFMSLVLKEKDFRTSLQQTDWQQYAQTKVGHLLGRCYYSSMGITCLS